MGVPGRPPVQPAEGAVVVLDVDGRDVPVPRERPPPQAPRAVMFFVVVAAATGLIAGYVLGRGQRGLEPTGTTKAETTAETTLPAATSTSLPSASTVVSRFGDTRLRLGDGRGVTTAPAAATVTAYADHNVVTDLALDSEGALWTVGPGGVLEWDVVEQTYVEHRGSTGESFLGASQVAAGPNSTVSVATDWGLAHWTGEEWVEQHFSYPRDVHVMDMAITGDGKLALAAWTGDGYSGLYWDEAAEEELRGWFIESVWGVSRLHPGENGTLFAITDGRQLWIGDDGELTPQPINLPAEGIEHVVVDAAGTTWLANFEQLWRVSNDSVVEVPTGGISPFFGGPSIVGLAPAEGSGIWLTTLQWDGSDGESAHLIRINEEGPTEPIEVPGQAGWWSTMVSTPDGMPWVSSNNGVLGFDGSGWHRLSIPDDPPIGQIASLAVGTDGSLWSAGEAGITRFDGQRWQFTAWDDIGESPETEVGWFGDWPYWLGAGSEGSMWAGSSGWMTRWENGAWTPILRLGDPEVWQECQMPAMGPDASVWIVCGGRSGAADIERFDGTDFIAVPSARRVNDISVAPDGTAWLASDLGISRLVGDEWIESLGGLSFHQILAISADEVWAVGDDSLWRLWNGSWSLVKDQAPVHDIASSGDGLVWVLMEGRFPPGERLWRIEGESMRSYFTAPNLQHVAVAEDGTVWVGGDSVLYQVEPSGE